MLSKVGANGLRFVEGEAMTADTNDRFSGTDAESFNTVYHIHTMVENKKNNDRKYIT